MKYNKLAIISFIFVIGGFIISYVVLSDIVSLFVLIGFILGLISYFQIKKTKEKGIGFLITLLVIFILIVTSMILLYLPIFK
jgi:heme/copper-type cytochrome/quinol oxidase subunit 4